MRRVRATLAVLLVLAVTAACVRLGIWQLDRRAEKQRLNAARRSALAAAPRALGDRLPPAVPEGVVAIRGRYDAARHVLLGGRTHEGEPGVEVFTPLRLSSGQAVLVHRGWLPARDPTEAHPERHVEAGERVVRGLAEPLARPRRGAAISRLPGDSATVWLALRLDPDTLAARLPYPIAPFTLRELPGPGVPDLPRRTLPPAFDESVHLGYAVQWFAMAAIVLGGSLLLAVRANRSRGPRSLRSGPRPPTPRTTE